MFFCGEVSFIFVEEVGVDIDNVNSIVKVEVIGSVGGGNFIYGVVDDGSGLVVEVGEGVSEGYLDGENVVLGSFCILVEGIV